MGFLPPSPASSLTLFLLNTITAIPNFLKYLERAVFSHNLYVFSYSNPCSCTSPCSVHSPCAVDAYLKYYSGMISSRKLYKFILPAVSWPLELPFIENYAHDRAYPHHHVSLLAVFAVILWVSWGQKLFLSFIFLTSVFPAPSIAPTLEQILNICWIITWMNKLKPEPC